MTARGRAAAICLLLVGSSLALPVTGLAQGPPIQTDTPIMLGLQGSGVRTMFTVVRRATRRRGGHRIVDPVDRSVTAYVVPVAVPYNLTPTLQVGLLVPLVTKVLRSGGTDRTRTGAGDLTLSAKKLLLQVDRRGETFRVAAKGTVKLPTGDDDAPVALGTGSIDVGGSLVAGWIKGRWGLCGETLYVHNASKGQVDSGVRNPDSDLAGPGLARTGSFARPGCGRVRVARPPRGPGGSHVPASRLL